MDIPIYLPIIYPHLPSLTFNESGLGHVVELDADETSLQTYHQYHQYHQR